MNNTEYSLFTDGGSRGNPGNAAIGFVVYKNDKEIFTFKKFLGICTNNIAEYTALVYALTYLNKQGIKEVTCFLDSELVVKQLNGLYKVKDEKMKMYNERVQLLKKEFTNITFNHVLREKNKLADKLVNEALDEQENSKEQIAVSN